MTAGVSAVRARLGRRPERYAYCPVDGFLFRPLYTDGKCPVCGEAAADGAPTLPLAVRLDRFWVGMAALGLVSVGMSVLVLYMYFR